jgi:hypothetical protein
MIEPIRITAEEARKKTTSGEALLVCAYDDEVKFSKMHLQDAISLQGFMTRFPTLSKEHQIIFY